MSVSPSKVNVASVSVSPNKVGVVFVFVSPKKCVWPLCLSVPIKVGVASLSVSQ